MDVYELFENAQKVNEEWIKVIISEYLIENELILVDMQQSQWEKGEDDKGNLLGIYKPLTEIISRGRKKAGEPYNLYDTGSFYRGTFIEVKIESNNVIIIFDSSGSTKQPLIEKLGDRVFGLQEINIGKLSELTEENLIEKFIQTLKIE